MFGIRRPGRQPSHQAGETRWRVICGPLPGESCGPSEYTHWHRGRPVIYATWEAAEKQAGEVRSWNPGMDVHTEPTTEPVPPSLGDLPGRDCSSYTPLDQIPLIWQIAQALDQQK